MTELDLFKPFPASTDIAERAARSEIPVPGAGELARRDGPAWTGPGRPPAWDGLRQARRIVAATGDALDRYAQAVIELNETSETPRSVAKLNQAFREHSRINFGVESSGMTPRKPAAAGDREGDVAVARIRVIIALYEEYHRLEDSFGAVIRRFRRDLAPVALHV